MLKAQAIGAALAMPVLLYVGFKLLSVMHG
jgi:hypothetical protein